MSDDWKPGDLALCLKIGPWRGYESGLLRQDNGMRAGVIARVRGVGLHPEAGTVLWFEGWPGECLRDSFVAARFRKVTPDEADEFDRETIALLNGTPAPSKPEEVGHD